MNVEDQQVEHPGSVEHRVIRLEGRVDNIEPMVKDHDNVIFRGAAGQPSIIAHIADTNTKLDYNNKRLDDLNSIGQAILSLFKKVGWSAVRILILILLTLGAWGVFGGWVKQKIHDAFPSWPMAQSNETSVEYPQDARSWTP